MSYFFDTPAGGLIMRKLLITAATAASIAVTSASAGIEGEQRKATYLDHFSIENVTEVLQKVGATGISSGVTEDKKFSFVRFEFGGIGYIAILTACKETPRCAGLLLGTALGASPTETVSFEAVNNFNDTLAFAKVTRTDDGKAVVLSRYVIADGGIADENLATNIAVFTALPQVFAKYLSAQKVASMEPSSKLAVEDFSTETNSKAEPFEHNAVEEYGELITKETHSPIQFGPQAKAN
jgi:hypothetical protein